MTELTYNQIEQQAECKKWIGYTNPDISCSWHGKQDCTNICSYAIKQSRLEKASQQK